jgi:hypothetical protein
VEEGIQNIPDFLETAEENVTLELQAKTVFPKIRCVMLFERQGVATGTALPARKIILLRYIGFNPATSKWPILIRLTISIQKWIIKLQTCLWKSETISVFVFTRKRI